MRRLDGFAHEDKCSINRDMPILETPSGVRALMDALILTKKVLLPYCTHDGHGEDLSAPVMCLLTEGEEGIFTKEAAVKAMNRIWQEDFQQLHDLARVHEGGLHR
ncbi:uncharacterized protein KRP23_5129 [Phytophthora ramorum]|uniref:uncharacterized protein n=1 Tax=Phytophthora ramorum TaxID=164328 RepID=UPI0030B04FC8|nr:hypothetical protein KRP23_5129 [Phytophthora ramorum]